MSISNFASDEENEQDYVDDEEMFPTMKKSSLPHFPGKYIHKHGISAAPDMKSIRSFKDIHKFIGSGKKTRVRISSSSGQSDEDTTLSPIPTFPSEAGRGIRGQPSSSPKAVPIPDFMRSTSSGCSRKKNSKPDW